LSQQTEEETVKKFEQFNRLIPYVADWIRQLKRGFAGLPIEESAGHGMTNFKELIERTRATQRQALQRTYMRSVYDIYGAEYYAFYIISEYLDKYAISEEGKQRIEEILMEKAKMPEPLATQLVLPTLPAVETELTKPKEEKKHWYSRGKKE